MKNKIALALMMGAMAATSEAQIKETPLLKIGNDVTSLEEFNYIYNKNNSAAQFPISKQEYFELFVNYKLKVAEGKALGLDTTKQYKNESQYYYNEVARPFLQDTIAQKEAEVKAMARFAQEVDASHILIKLGNNPTPADTLEAYNKLEAIRQRIVKGEDFNKVASETSEDPSARQNGGRLGYFTAMQMITPFEDMAYTIGVGEVSPVFRTRFGYHILKVHDRCSFRGQMQTAHIMFMAHDSATFAQGKEKADSLYTLIKNGADFAELASKYSEDKRSAVNGGLMPWLTRDGIIPEYAEPAFALKYNGDYTQPVQSRYGWHIIKRIDWRNERPQEELESYVARAKSQGHEIATAGNNALAHKLMKKYNLQWNQEALALATGIVMSQENDSIKQAKLEAIETPLATYADKKIMASKDLIRAWISTAIPYESFDALARKEIMEYEKTNLMVTNPDFKYTMKEYYDGLLVFEVNSKLIWSHNDIDSTSLVALYEQNPSRYAKGSTFNGTIYFCNTEKDAQEIEKMAVKNPDKAEKIAMRVIKGEQSQGGIYDDYIWPNIKSKYVVVTGTKTEGEKQEYSQVKGQLISDYQQREEVEKIAELKKKYNPKILTKIK